MDETSAEMEALQRLIERSAATAGPAVRKNFADPAWTMSARELINFWGTARMASIATVSASGAVHAAPLEIRLSHGIFHVPHFADAVRLRDLRANARCAITAWQDAYHAVIVYGRASLPESDAAGMVDVVVRPTRVYAIRPPSWHHAAEKVSTHDQL